MTTLRQPLPLTLTTLRQSLTLVLSLSDPSWTEDNLSLWRSSNVTVRRGLIDGNNSPTGARPPPRRSCRPQPTQLARAVRAQGPAPARAQAGRC